MPRIALDATYSLGDALSGVGVYSRQLLLSLAAAHPEDGQFRWCYRPNRILRSFKEPLPANVSRRLLRYSSAPKCDLFHGLNQRVEFPPGKTKCKIVTTFHDLFVLTGDYSTADFRARFAEQARRAAERSDAIIAVSQFTANQIRELLRVGGAPIHVVHHGVHPPAETPPTDAARENIVLHVGAIQKRKNLERLIQAFEALPDSWKLVLAGSTGYGGEAALDRAQLSKAAQRIEITGYVDNAGLEALYRKARILAFPSLDEGFGIPVIEAMSRGLPVLTSDGSALAEVAGGAALLVEPRSVEAIAHGLLTLATAPGLRNHLAQAGLTRAKQFSWKQAAAQTWTAYEMTLAAV